MKKLIRVFILSMIITCSLFSSVFATNWKNVKFVNHTGQTIYRLYFTYNYRANKNWYEDYLGSGVLEDGESINLRYNEDLVYFDFKIDFNENGDGFNWQGYNLSGVWRVTFYPDGNGGYNAVRN